MNNDGTNINGVMMGGQQPQPQPIANVGGVLNPVPNPVPSVVPDVSNVVTGPAPSVEPSANNVVLDSVPNVVSGNPVVDNIGVVPSVSVPEVGASLTNNQITSDVNNSDMNILSQGATVTPSVVVPAGSDGGAVNNVPTNDTIMSFDPPSIDGNPVQAVPAVDNVGGVVINQAGATDTSASVSSEQPVQNAVPATNPVQSSNADVAGSGLSDNIVSVGKYLGYIFLFSIL